jgi:hypothetical protein
MAWSVAFRSWYNINRRESMGDESNARLCFIYRKHVISPLVPSSYTFTHLLYNIAKHHKCSIPPQSSSPNISLTSPLCSFSTASSIYAHIPLATFSLLLATAPHLFHSFSTSSLCSFVTLVALPAFKLSSLARISVFSASRSCTLAMRSAVLSSEFREDRVLRRVLAVAVSCVVSLRRCVICVSSNASSSGVHEHERFCGGRV